MNILTRLSFIIFMPLTPVFSNRKIISLSVSIEKAK